jgi:hypothetical protein
MHPGCEASRPCTGTLVGYTTDREFHPAPKVNVDVNGFYHHRPERRSLRYEPQFLAHLMIDLQHAVDLLVGVTRHVTGAQQFHTLRDRR